MSESGGGRFEANVQGTASYLGQIIVGLNLFQICEAA